VVTRARVGKSCQNSAIGPWGRCGRPRPSEMVYANGHLATLFPFRAGIALKSPATAAISPRAGRAKGALPGGPEPRGVPRPRRRDPQLGVVESARGAVPVLLPGSPRFLPSGRVHWCPWGRDHAAVAVTSDRHRCQVEQHDPFIDSGSHRPEGAGYCRLNCFQRQWCSLRSHLMTRHWAKCLRLLSVCCRPRAGSSSPIPAGSG
jgi:hypothetical protein